jgi:hypothetical protein
MQTAMEALLLVAETMGVGPRAAWIVAVDLPLRLD